MHANVSTTSSSDIDVSAPLGITLTPIGGPTALIEYAGLRLLTDPTFDDAGTYPTGGRALQKLAGPARRFSHLGAIDAVLLSHDQHPDNLDHTGRRALGTAGAVLTTTQAAERLDVRAVGLVPGDEHHLEAPDGTRITITGLPARHGPEGSEPLTGPVIGFLITAPGRPTVYVSGDNASLDVVADIARRVGPIDVAVLFAGGAQTPLLGDAYLTLTSRQAAIASLLLGRPHTMVLHTDGWAHFTETSSTLPPAFAEVGVADRLVPATAGASIHL
jgi:L-ascorbate metabolism protein UlaG (beta-lactamase superfamily)